MLCCVLIIRNHYHLNHTSEKCTASISNTKDWGLCLLCFGALCISSRDSRNLLHIKNGRFGCFVNQNPGPPIPRWASWQTFMSSQNPETLFESLKGWKPCISSLAASKSWRDKEGRNGERGESENGEGEGTVQCQESKDHSGNTLTDCSDHFSISEGRGFIFVMCVLY